MKYHNITQNIKINSIFNCPLCGTKDGYEVFKYDYAIGDNKVWCKKCGLIRQELIFDVESSNKFYEKYYLDYYLFDHEHNNFVSMQEKHFQYQINSVNRRIEVELISSILRDSIVPIEVGTSSGGIISMLSKVNNKIVGIDIDEKAIEFGKSKGLNVKYQDISKLDDKYDFIWTSHVMEHISSISWFLKQIERISLPNAKFIFIVPNSLAMPELPHVPHVFNFAKRQAIQLVEENTKFRLFKEFTEVKDDLFLVFDLKDDVEPTTYNGYETSYDDYKKHMMNLAPKLLMRYRWMYEGSENKSERKLSKEEFKKISKFMHPFSKWLLWSKLYIFFTGKVFKYR